MRKLVVSPNIIFPWWLFYPLSLKLNKKKKAEKNMSSTLISIMEMSRIIKEKTIVEWEKPMG